MANASWFWKHTVQPGLDMPPLGIPRRYENAEVLDIHSDLLRTAVRKYGAEFVEVAPNGVAPLFAGVAGAGKTYAAAVLAKAIHHGKRLPVLWCNCAEELTWFDREAFSRDVVTRIERLKTAPFVVMDDFTQFKSGRPLDTLCEIGSARYNALLPTLWTGNITIAKGDFTELENAVGVMLARRIAEMSEGFRVMVRQA